jgi:hypothetical protein
VNIPTRRREGSIGTRPRSKATVGIAIGEALNLSSPSEL